MVSFLGPCCNWREDMLWHTKKPEIEDWFDQKMWEFTVLSIWMAPLHPIADILHVGTQKDIYGLRFSHNTIGWLIIKYISPPSSWLLCYFAMLSCIRDSLHVQLAHHSWVSVAASREWIYSRVALIATRESFAGCPSTYPWICLLTFKHKNTHWSEIS